MNAPAPDEGTGPAHLPLLMLGYVNVDLVARVPRLPVDGDRVTAAAVETHFGGMAANAACAAAQAGTRPIFFGSFGADAFGPLAAADLASHGVDVEHASHVAPSTTKALILVTPAGERAIVSEPTVYDPEPLRTFLDGYRGRPGLVYTDGYHVGWAHRELRLARRRGFRIYCDLDGAPDTYATADLWQALEVVDIAQLSASLVERLGPAAGAAGAIDRLGSVVPVVIRTAGSRAVALIRNGHRTSLPVRAVAAVDATGAGDALAGTTLAWLARGTALDDAVLKGMEAARHAIGYVGARAPDSIRHDALD